MSEKGHSIYRSVVVTALLALLIQPGLVEAYVDPNTGGWLFQMLMPAFTAAMGAWLLLRRRIAERVRQLWRQISGRDPTDP